jgi:hypothetical protein
LAERGKKQPSNIQTVLDRIAGKQAGVADANTVTGGHKVNIPGQHVPHGYEALTYVPTWADNGGGYRAQQVIPGKLAHAIGIPGTNHVFISDVKLSNQQLEASLADFKKAAELTGHLFPGGMAVHVPAADNGRYGRERGWVYQKPDKRVFFMRPSVMKDQGAYSNDESRRRQAAYKAQQEKVAINRAAYGLGSASYHGHSMPAQDINPRLYTMIHEIGHVYDAKMNHLGDRLGRGATVNDQGLFRAKRNELSRYGATSQKEGYAEAFAQFYLGGKGSSSVADAYSRVYGWRPA